MSGNSYSQTEFTLVPETPTATTINAFHNKKFSENGYFAGADFVDLCVNFTKVVSGPKEIKVKFRIDDGMSISSSGTFTDEFNSHNVCMVNDWDYKFELADANVSETHQISMEFFKIEDGKDILLQEFSWDINVLADNTAPLIASLDVNGNGNFVTQGIATWMTIYGSGFLPEPVIKIDGASVAINKINYVSLSEIQVEIPNTTATGVVDVMVINPSNNLSDTASGTSDGLNVLAPMSTATNTEFAGVTGGNLNITGAHFHEDIKVKIGTVPCENIAVVTPNANGIGTELNCTIPAMPQGTYVINLTNPDGDSEVAEFDIELNPAPVIQSIDKNSVMLAAGTSVNLQVDNILTTPTPPTVDVIDDGGGLHSCTPLTVVGNTINCETPSMVAGTYDIVVSNHDGQSDTYTDMITYNPIPTITDVNNPDFHNASSTSGGYWITIEGSGFIDGLTITVGGQVCQNANVFNAHSSLICQTPAIAGDGQFRDIVITNPDTQSVTSSIDGKRILYLDPPTVSMSYTHPNHFLHPSSQLFSIAITFSTIPTGFDLTDLSYPASLGGPSLTGAALSWTFSASGTQTEEININFSAGKFKNAFGIQNESGASASFDYLHPSDLKATPSGWLEGSLVTDDLVAHAKWSLPNEVGDQVGQSLEFFSDVSCSTSRGPAVALNGIAETQYKIQSYTPGDWYYTVTTVHEDGGGTNHNFESDCSAKMQFSGVISSIIKENCGSAPAGIPCFTSLSGWNSGIVSGHTLLSNKDLITQGKKLITYIDGFWNNPDDTRAAIYGWNTNTNKHLVFKTVGQSRHNGSSNNPLKGHYRLNPSTDGSVIKIGYPSVTGPFPVSTDNTAFTEFDGIVIDKAYGTSISAIKIYASGTKLKNMIIHDVHDLSANNYGDAIYIDKEITSVDIENTIIYDVDRSAVLVHAEGASFSNMNINIKNSTFINVCNQLSGSSKNGKFPAVGVPLSSGTYTNVNFNVLNTMAECKIGIDSRTKGEAYQVISGANFSTSDYNIGNSGTVPGSNSYTNVSFIDQTFSGIPLGHQVYFESLSLGFESFLLLDHPDNLAINRGIDLSSSVPFDIEGEKKSLIKKSNDIGADEVGSIYQATELSFDHDKVLEREVGPHMLPTALKMKWKPSLNGNLTNQTVFLYGNTTANRDDGCDGDVIGSYNLLSNTIASKNINISAETYEWYSFFVASSFANGSTIKSACSRPQRVIATDIIKWMISDDACFSIGGAACVDNINAVTPINLTTAKKRMRIEIDGNPTYAWNDAWPSTIELSGWTGDADYFLTLKAVNDARHNGKYAAGNFRVDPADDTDGVCIGLYHPTNPQNSSLDNHTRIDGFIIEGITETALNYDTVGVWVRSRGVEINNMIIRDVTRSNSFEMSHGVYLRDANASVTVHNTLGYNIAGNFLKIDGQASSLAGTKAFVRDSTIIKTCIAPYNVNDLPTTKCSAIGYAAESGNAYTNSSISVHNSIVDGKLHTIPTPDVKSPAFRLGEDGDSGSIQGSNVFVTDSSAEMTTNGMASIFTNAIFPNSKSSVALYNSNIVSSAAANNVVFVDLTSSNKNLKLFRHGSIPNDAFDYVDNTNPLLKDIEEYKRDYRSEVGAHEERSPGKLEFQISSSTISKHDFGILSGNGTRTINIKNTGSTTVANVTASLINSASTAYSISGCSGVTLLSNNTCSLTVNYTAKGSDGLKRGSIEVTGLGALNNAISIEATKVP